MTAWPEAFRELCREGKRQPQPREADGRWEQDFPIDPQTILSRDFDGIDLSGGQWQRIAIARGIYRNAKLLLMDEPTAAIDPQQESSLYQTFLRAARGRTCILITHRLGLARIADRIVVLKDGRVVETGSHRELLEKILTFISETLC